MNKVITDQDIATIAIEYMNVYGEEFANKQIKVDFPRMNSEAVSEWIEYLLK